MFRPSRSFRILWAGLLVAAPAAASGPGEPGAGTGPLHKPIEFVRSLLGHERPALVRTHHAVIGTDHAGLSFTLSDERVLEIALAGGEVLVDHRAVGRYFPGGPLHTSWRGLVDEATRQPTGHLVELAGDWDPPGLHGAEVPVARRIRARLASLAAVLPQGPEPQAIPPAGPGGAVVSLDDLSDPARLEVLLRQAASTPLDDLRLTVTGGIARYGHYSIGSGETRQGHLLVLRGDADIYGRLDGNLATVDGDIIVHPGSVVTGDVLALGGEVMDKGGIIQGEIRTLSPVPARGGPGAGHPAVNPGPTGLALVLRNAAGLAGVFITLVALGFGLVLFGRPNLETVADTVSHSFGRAFLVGLIAEMLLLPTFGMLVVGLLLSVVGVLLIPFAVLAYVLLLLVGVVGGYLAVAHALGENYTRRRLALGASTASPNSYRYVLAGLGAMLALWGAWVVFGWVPVAGTLIGGAAFLVTWLLATVGFGATLLSRAGARESFAGRIIPPEALTDEYLWATPQFGVPAAKRPVPRTRREDDL